MSTFTLLCGTGKTVFSKFARLAKVNVAFADVIQRCALSTITQAKIVVPKNYNFVRDHMEVLAAEERSKGKKVAFWWADNAGNELKYSYTDLVEFSKKLANGLQNQGLKPGDRVLLLLPRVPEWWLTILAGIRCGVVPIPATIMLTEKDIQHRLEAAKPKMIFTIPEMAPKVDKAVANSSHKCMKILCPQLTSTVSSQSGWTKFEELTSNVKSEHECRNSSTDDTMMIYFTSGTTGMPKMVELTHSYAIGHAFSTAPMLGSPPDSLVWAVADPGWVATLYCAFFPPWYNRSTVFSYYIPPSPPVWSHIFDILKKYPIRALCTPPTVYRMLLHEKLPNPKDFPHWKDCATGGEALNAETYYTWKEKFGFDIRELYGQTETPAIIGNKPGTKIKPGSFGLSLGYDIRVVDDNLNENPPNKEGHIAIKYRAQRPFLFKQYIDDPKKTAECFRGDYYLTGDTGHRDKEGYFYFSSRSDDVIISSGYRIGPFEVESAILAHPSVLESAAIGIPDKERGEIVKAFIVLKNEYKNHDKQKLIHEIQDTVKKVTAPYKYPRKIEFVDELPKTISQKIKRSDLRKKEWAAHKH